MTINLFQYDQITFKTHIKTIYGKKLHKCAQRLNYFEILIVGALLITRKPLTTSLNHWMQIFIYKKIFSHEDIFNRNIFVSVTFLAKL